MRIKTKIQQLFFSVQCGPSHMSRVTFLNYQSSSTFMCTEIIDCSVLFNKHVSSADGNVISTKGTFFYFYHGIFISLCN